VKNTLKNNRYYNLKYYLNKMHVWYYAINRIWMRLKNIFILKKLSLIAFASVYFYDFNILISK
jgi:hypothetical protein